MELAVEKSFAVRYLLRPVPTQGGFGGNVTRLRVRAGMNGKQLAVKLGVKPPYVTGLEKNYQGLPETPTLLRLAKALHCSVDELLAGVDPDYDEVRSDLIRQTVDQRSSPSERRADVPASPVIEARRLESDEYKKLVAETEAIATRLLDIAGELANVELQDRSAAHREPGSRRSHRKTG